MPRPLRKVVPGLPHHLWIRGNNKLPCFFTDKDRHVYLKCLGEEAEARDCDIHAYVLMTNHVHLLATGRKERSVSRFMQTLNRRYCRYVNQEHDRTGTLYEGRFNSSMVEDDEYFLTLMRYIELNPVRARMVPRPEDFRWSSYLENVGGTPGGLLTPHPVYDALGTNRYERSFCYLRLFDIPIDNDALDRIRNSILKGGPTGPEPVPD